MILTGLGFLVGVEGFKTILASSHWARMLLLPFLCKSCPLTVRVWPSRLILPLLLSGPHSQSQYASQLLVPVSPGRTFLALSHCYTFKYTLCLDALRRSIGLQQQRHLAKCFKKAEQGGDADGERFWKKTNLSFSFNKQHLLYYIPGLAHLCLSFYVLLSLTHTADFKPSCILPLFNPCGVAAAEHVIWCI